MSTTNSARRVASPEWVVAGRSDIDVDTTLVGGWGVSPAPLARSASFTNFAEREMAVPVGNSPSEKAVRTHELIHARVSPTRIPVQLMEQIGVTSSSVRTAEEVRVNFLANADLMKRKGHPGTADLCDGSEKGLATKAVENGDWSLALSLYLNTFNTKVHKVVKRKLRTVPQWKESLSVIEKQMKDWDCSRNNHHWEHRVAFTSPITYRYVNGRFGKTEDVLLGQGFIEYTLPLAEQIDGWIADPPRKTTKVAGGLSRVPNYRKMHGQWETLRFGMTSLTESTTSFMGRRKRPAMTGKFPSRPDRLLTDPERRIFRETVRSEGGIVVFDCSGSMSVTHQEVRDVVAKYAGVTVVAYTWRGRNVANAWILARNGRMISESDFEEIDLNNGNGVDGPILRWAIRQRRSPKDFIIWVSDGFVTGRGDSSTDNLMKECAQLSVRHNIIGVKDSEEALSLLADMKRTGLRPRHKFVSAIAKYVKGDIDNDYE